MSVIGATVLSFCSVTICTSSSIITQKHLRLLSAVVVPPNGCHTSVTDLAVLRNTEIVTEGNGAAGGGGFGATFAASVVADSLTHVWPTPELEQLRSAKSSPMMPSAPKATTLMRYVVFGSSGSTVAAGDSPGSVAVIISPSLRRAYETLSPSQGGHRTVMALPVARTTVRRCCPRGSPSVSFTPTNSSVSAPTASPVFFSVLDLSISLRKAGLLSSSSSASFWPSANLVTDDMSAPANISLTDMADTFVVCFFKLPERAFISASNAARRSSACRSSSACSFIDNFFLADAALAFSALASRNAAADRSPANTCMSLIFCKAASSFAFFSARTLARAAANAGDTSSSSSCSTSCAFLAKRSSFRFRRRPAIAAISFSKSLRAMLAARFLSAKARTPSILTALARCSLRRLSSM
mmetsp:Transcript_28047/g.83831  ORF Transcript_28047/g.83831 Transcript_28047/m.83831 type:complete len:412 (-) Transcript_28047:828-2063(-)